MDIDLFLKVLQQFGVAGLFIIMYLATSAYLLKQMQTSKKEVKEMVERTIKALDRSSAATEEASRVKQVLVASTEQLRIQTGEFIAYLKGRDVGGRMP